MYYWAVIVRLGKGKLHSVTEQIHKLYTDEIFAFGHLIWYFLMCRTAKIASAGVAGTVLDYRIVCVNIVSNMSKNKAPTGPCLPMSRLE
jgi:hypothetical protein